MLIKQTHYAALVRKMAGEELGASDRLIALRRLLRHDATLADIAVTGLQRDIRHLKRSLPFTQAKLDAALEHLASIRTSRRQARAKIGRYLRDNCELLESLIGWDRLCDVLCVNPVHRSEAAEADKGLLGITWIGGQFEDSAANYGTYAWGVAPITQAIDTAMIEFMRENMHKLPDPFAPGGPFYGVPTYTLQPDGSMQRNAPDLVVHKPDGSSAVVSRKDGS